MIFAVLASDAQKEEIAHSPFFRKHELVYSENGSLWENHQAEIFMDLLFKPTPERSRGLAKLLPKPVLVNDVLHTLDTTNPAFVRINAWPGFLRGKYLEAAAGEEMQAKLRTLLGEDILFVKDLPGLIAPRILSMVINEAFFTLQAGTATKDEIDMAMKLGTGYPYGPFEWGEKIGLDQIRELLLTLAKGDPVYHPAEFMKG